MKRLKEHCDHRRGAMAIYTVKELIKSETPLCLSILTTKSKDWAAGLPYSVGHERGYMYC